MESKKPFSDKRWNQPLGGTVIEYSELTLEEKERAKKYREEIIKEIEKAKKL